jgi:hypothetical protein
MPAIVSRHSPNSSGCLPPEYPIGRLALFASLIRICDATVAHHGTLLWGSIKAS